MNRLSQPINHLPQPDSGTAASPLSDILRAAGHWLDSQERPLACLYAAHDDVVVGLGSAQARAGIAVRALSYDDLARVAVRGAAERGTGGAWFGSRDGLFPTGYEDALRLLGVVAGHFAWRGVWLTVVDRYVLASFEAGMPPLVLGYAAWHKLLNDAATTKRVDPTSVHAAVAAAKADFAAYLPAHKARPCGRASRYACLLDGLAVACTARRATPTAIAETDDGGFVAAAWTASGDLCRVALSDDELERLAGQSARARLRDARIGLRALGGYFDERGAAAITACALDTCEWAVDGAVLCETPERASSLERRSAIVHTDLSTAPATRRWPWSRG